ncbi:MAG: winged helix-turn-helix transcriptional regulator [Ruminococcaceae bacterium]|nr:winged helix-turn-helix transcriptional regulator [Oscillospiraceae bacterium]
MTDDVNSYTLLKQTVREFMRANKLHRDAFSHVASKYGMHRGQHRMLMYICKKGGDVSQKQIASAMDVSPAAITVMLNKLEETGYIVRTPSAVDSRINHIMPTEKAHQLVDESCMYFDSLDKMLFADFDDESLKVLCAAFEKMQYNMNNLIKEETDL